MKRGTRIPRRLGAMVFVVALIGSTAHGAFDCGSNGSDGALTFDAPTTTTVIDFDPASFDPPLDADHDGVYNFTTVTIPANLVLRIRADKVGWKPMYWLATGSVAIDGTLDLSGNEGHRSSDTKPGSPSLPGPGGYPGGWGGSSVLGTSFSQGWGQSGRTTHKASHAGNYFLQPLTGGDGAPGYSSTPACGEGGGAGGGALLLASNTEIRLDGSLKADGGVSGLNLAGTLRGGVGGAGGALRLMAPQILGSGSMTVGRGSGSYYPADEGWIRLESLQDNFTGSFGGCNRLRRVTLVAGAPNIFPSGSTVGFRVARINGIELPPSPTGSFEIPDVVLNTANPVLFEIEAENIPLGTRFTLSLWNQTLRVDEFQTDGLSGTLASSHASASRAVQYGYTVGIAWASWNP